MIVLSALANSLAKSVSSLIVLGNSVEKVHSRGTLPVTQAHKRCDACARSHRERQLAAQAHHSLRKFGCHYSGCQPNALAIYGNVTTFAKFLPKWSECY